jgi:enoyl-CoA hydratase/carnithine racemase
VLRDYPPVEAFRAARTLRTPLIAGVNGAAMGGGFGLVCAAHLAVAAESARFSLPEIKIGTFPATVLPLLLPVIGERKALDLALTGRTIGAEEALQMGVVGEVVPDADLKARTEELAGLIASYSPMATSLGLASVVASRDMSFGESLDYFNAMRAISFGTEDLHEGSRAFLDKRPPVWRGR